jgi:ankyrin repeat protein
LLQACREGHVAVVSMLLDAGADIEGAGHVSHHLDYQLASEIVLPAPLVWGNTLADLNIEWSPQRCQATFIKRSKC